MGEYNVKYNIVVDTGNSASQINALSTAISTLAETSKQKVSEYQQHIGGLQTGVHKPVTEAVKYLNPLQEKFNDIAQAAMSVCTLDDYFKEFAQKTSQHITVLNKSLDTTIARLSELHRQMNKLDGGAKYFNRDGSSFSKMFDEKQVKNLNEAAKAMEKATLAAQGKSQPKKQLTDEQLKANSIHNLANAMKKMPEIQNGLSALPQALAPLAEAGTTLQPFVQTLKKAREHISAINREMKRFKTITGVSLKTAMDREDRISGTRNPNRRRQSRESYRNTRARAAARRIASSSKPSTFDSRKRWFGIGDLMYGAGFPFPDMIGIGMLGMGISHILSQYSEFEHTMRMARNILKTSDSDTATFAGRFDDMQRNIRQIGIETKYTTTEVAGAAKFLAMAGMSTEDINNSMKSIASLSIITDAPLERMADVVTNIQTAYGIESERMPRVADILASVASNSNTTVLEMGEAMKFAAPMMSMARVSFNEAAAAVGALANAGLKGTVAGTALRAMMTRLLAPTKKGAAVLEKYNIQLYEMDKATGKKKLRSLTDIFTQFKQQGATVQDMIAVFDKIGGNAANNLFANLLQLPELVQKSLHSSGMANRLADDLQNTMSGKWAKITSQFTELGIQTIERVDPIVKTGMDQILQFLAKPNTAVMFAQIGSSLMGISKAILGLVDVISSNWDWLSYLFIGRFLVNRKSAFVSWVKGSNNPTGKRAKATKMVGKGLKDVFGGYDKRGLWSLIPALGLGSVFGILDYLAGGMSSGLAITSALTTLVAGSTVGQAMHDRATRTGHFTRNRYGLLGTPFKTLSLLDPMLFGLPSFLISLTDKIKFVREHFAGLMRLIGFSGVKAGMGVGRTLIACIGGLSTIITGAIAGLAVYAFKVWSTFNQAKAQILQTKQEIADIEGMVNTKEGEKSKKTGYIGTDNKNFLTTRLGFNVASGGAFTQDKVFEALREQGRKRGAQLVNERMKEATGMTPAEIQKNPAKFDQLIKTVTAPRYNLPYGSLTLDADGLLYSTISVANSSGQAIALTDKNFYNLKPVSKGIVDYVTNIGDPKLTAIKEMGSWFKLTDSQRKVTDPMPYIRNLYKQIIGVDIDSLAKITNPYKRGEKLNEWNELLQQDDRISWDWINDIISLLPKSYTDNVPQLEDYSNRPVNLGETTESGSNGVNGTGKVSADPTKRITLNIQNLIGSFTVEYNGPEDQVKIKDIVMQTIIDAANEATMGLMSQS